MSLQKGNKAPQFKLKSTSGEFDLEDRRGKKTILYFYPKDFTYGCTKQACTFRDEFSEFKDLDIEVFGINKDTVETHLKFKKDLKLPFELISDPSGRISKKYEAIMPIIGLVKRITYLINEDLEIETSYESLTGFDKHVKKILASKTGV
jgi:peroxiredoxin Q/BCP